MKRLLMTAATFFVLLLMPQVSQGFDVYGKANYGPLLSDNSNATFMRAVTLDIPVVTINDKGIAINTETSVFYSNNNGNETQGQRVIFLAAKNILSKAIKDGNGVITGWGWKWWLGGGSGMWNIENTAGEDQQETVYNLSTGVSLSEDGKGIMVGLSAGVDFIKLTGADSYWPHLGLSLGF